MDNQAIILFDGVCNLCNNSVQFIIRHDKDAYFKFASLQSDFGRQLKEAKQIPNDVDSIILVENGKVYMQSSAILRIARHLDGAWKLAAAALFIPRPIRDIIYRYVARNRYRWFGRQDQCMLPSPDLKERFL
ncbi:thiol-disulfide oxidoreductase DCC family protein [Terribacillus saccharophilus]|uniref:Thiol-disulfide oxidoreductase n=1 Tax=Terribacillus saccharophilus TaxID=361277 RepID=A0A075LLZ7_9BACI|nr:MULTISPECIES: thiol-disulfide oxidoreductase DCC family protein [Terribacillus]AIF67369.1 thiol-disulfide oxidoreductase [Terribacillus goriensis]MCM3226922.1 thiol-disulfide oxidoreductase DCC family protein [Terribacillus saccharophilus]MEC0290998.1 thiol-disulfide oxidoreductase DCC family protein [Terribacillus saccharophilus]